MGQYCFARCRLSSSVTLAGAWRRGWTAVGRVGGRAADTARRASTVYVLGATPCLFKVDQFKTSAAAILEVNLSLNLTRTWAVGNLSTRI